MRTTTMIVAAALLLSPAAFAGDALQDAFARISRGQRQQVPRYHPLPDGAAKPQIRQLRRDVGKLMRILRGYHFLSQMGGDWAQYQMAQKISQFKCAAEGIERAHDLRGGNWVAGSERSRWQLLCKAITAANWQLTNPRAAAHVTQEQKVQTAAEALSRGLQLMRHAELRPYADSGQIDRVVNRVLWSPVAPPPPPGPQVLVVDASSRVTNNVSQRVTSVQQQLTSVRQQLTNNVRQQLTHVTQQLVAPTMVVAR